MSDRNTAIRRSQLKPIRYDDFDATNTPTDNQIPTYDESTGKFTWESEGFGTVFKKEFTNGDLSSGVLTVTHALGNQYCLVQVYNNDHKKIHPDDVELVDTNSLTVDLSSFGTITGTWYALVMDAGAETTVTTISSYKTSFTNSDLSSGVLSVTHGLGEQYCGVQVYDNDNKKIDPDEITLTGTDTLTVDLSSFGTLTGTWRVVVLSSGTTESTNLDTANFDGILSASDDTVQKAMETIDDHSHTTSYTTSFTNGDLSSGVLTVNHNLGEKYVVLDVYDDSDEQILPDKVTVVSTTQLTIDLSSFGTISGTWNLRVVK